MKRKPTFKDTTVFDMHRSGLFATKHTWCYATVLHCVLEKQTMEREIIDEIQERSFEKFVDQLLHLYAALLSS